MAEPSLDPQIAEVLARRAATRERSPSELTPQQARIRSSDKASRVGHPRPAGKDAVPETLQSVLSVDYRLAPEHRFPAAYDDAVDGVRWAHEHLKHLSGPALLRAVAVAGSSAGGNLAAGASRALAGTAAAPIAQLLVYPMLGGVDLPSRTTMADYGLSRETMIWYDEQYLNCDEDRHDVRYAPLIDTRLDRLPPTVISAAHFDPLHDDAQRYGELLSGQGVAVTYLDNLDLNHAFWGAADLSDAADRASREMCRQFGETIAGVLGH